MLHSVAPRDAALLQVTGYAWRGDADTRMGGQKSFESNSRRKAILHACVRIRDPSRVGAARSRRRTDCSAVPALDPLQRALRRCTMQGRLILSLRRNSRGELGAAEYETANDWNEFESGHSASPNELSLPVESGCGAVVAGLVCLLPPLSSGGAQVTAP